MLHDTEVQGSEEQRRYNALTNDEKQLLNYANERIAHWVGTNGVFSTPSINDIITGERISEIDLFNREKVMTLFITKDGCLKYQYLQILNTKKT